MDNGTVLLLKLMDYKCNSLIQLFLNSINSTILDLLDYCLVQIDCFQQESDVVTLLVKGDITNNWESGIMIVSVTFTYCYKTVLQYSGGIADTKNTSLDMFLWSVEELSEKSIIHCHYQLLYLFLFLSISLFHSYFTTKLQHIFLELVFLLFLWALCLHMCPTCTV